jgi:hypothetical protein
MTIDPRQAVGNAASNKIYEQDNIMKSVVGGHSKLSRFAQGLTGSGHGESSIVSGVPCKQLFTGVDSSFAGTGRSPRNGIGGTR